MKNKLNSGSLKNLEVGQSLLTQIRKLEGNKYSMEVAELILKPNSSFNFVGAFNASDKRFKQTSPRRAWLTGEAVDIERLLGVNVKELIFKTGENKRTTAEVNILNPIAMGLQMKVKVTESTIPTEFQLKNTEKAAKQITNKEGKTQYFKKDGKFIYSSSVVTGGKFEHSFVQHDEITEDSDFTVEKEIAASLEGTVSK